MSNDTTTRKPKYITDYFGPNVHMNDWMNEKAEQGYKFLTAVQSGECVQIFMELVEQPATPAPDPIVQGADNSDELLNACKLAYDCFANLHSTVGSADAERALYVAIYNGEARRRK